MSIAFDDPRTVGPRIRMMMPHLTPLERRVVDTMLGRRDFDETTPLRTVADDAGVSEAMVVKVTKKLGFSGFKDFRAGIVGYNSLPTTELHQELSPDDTSAEIAQKVFRTSIHALEETLSILDPEAFEKAADLIFTARQRDFYGIGGSAQIARDVSHKFLRIGVRTSVFDDAHMMLMSAALLGVGDVAVAFSHSGATTAVIEPLELARRRGARTIALTNYATSPLASTQTGEVGPGLMLVLSDVWKSPRPVAVIAAKSSFTSVAISWVSSRSCRGGRTWWTRRL